MLQESEELSLGFHFLMVVLKEKTTPRFFFFNFLFYN